jgi:hypothetical protein
MILMCKVKHKNIKSFLLEFPSGMEMEEGATLEFVLLASTLTEFPLHAC